MFVLSVTFKPEPSSNITVQQVLMEIQISRSENQRNITMHRSHLGMSSSPVTALGSGEYLGVVNGAGLTDWLPLM